MAIKTILKANGERVRFSKQKVELSLRRSGVTPKLAKAITNEVANEILENTTTDDIYKHAYRLLQNDGIHPTAARYSLKRAIHALGPTGFPFEQFVARLLSYRGLHTKVGVIVDGRCVTHEIDVLATDDNKERYIECKFHKDPGYTTNIKVPLYIHSRFLDIANKFADLEDTSAYREPWIVTNTRFSDDSIQYAQCTGIKLIGWNYPHGNGLEHLIEDIHLYPITVLTHLTDREKKSLLDADIVLCTDVLTQLDLLEEIGVPKSRREKIRAEATELCTGASIGR
jgi:hypothetical protein